MIDYSKKLELNQATLAVIGLGYVGLPITLAFAKKGVRVIGFDIDPQKINNLKAGIDITREATKEELDAVLPRINYTDNVKQLREANVIIVAVPTPIDENKTPNLEPLKLVSRLIGENLAQKSLIIFESTVYPGVTEEVCLPIIEKYSHYSLKKDEFYIGYSPERINPGDKVHSLKDTVKVVSGQNQEICDEVAKIYEIVVKAGVYKAESIRVAEAAKVIENTQRDLNIALMNELSLIFQRIGIDTEAVLRAAGTKWNFLKFYPGLVGGHCIGVDPYYLTSKSEQLGYHPQVVLAGRRINDSMGCYIAQETIKQLSEAGKIIRGANILILGCTFKENVPDYRNSKVVDIINELNSYRVKIYVHDPFMEKLPKEFHGELIQLSEAKDIDGIILTTPHDSLKKTSLAEYRKVCRQNNGKPVFIDVKWVFNKQAALEADFHYWRL